MRRWLFGLLLLATTAPSAWAQPPVPPGFVSLSLAGIGGDMTLASESRLPVRPRDAHWDGTLLTLLAAGQRGAVREAELRVPGAAAGHRFDLGTPNGASLRITLAAGSVLEPARGQGFIQVAELDARHTTGTFEGTIPQGHIPLVVHGRFEASFTPAAPAPARTDTP